MKIVLDAAFFEKFEKFWGLLWDLIDRFFQKKYGEDYKELD